MVRNLPGPDELLQLRCNLLWTDAAQSANCDGYAQGC